MIFYGHLAGTFAFTFAGELSALVADKYRARLWRNTNEQIVLNTACTGKLWVETYRLLTPLIEHGHIFTAFQAGIQARFEHGENGTR